MKIVESSDKQMIKVVAYHRVSTDVQDYDRQVQDVQRFCEYQQYNIIKSFSEKESGTIKERPELVAMMDFVKSNPNVLFVVISELSRLGRTSHVLRSIEALNDLKVGLISIKEGISTLNKDRTVNATSTMITSVLSSINSYELDTMTFRMRSGKVNSVKNGGVVQNENYPYGYMKDSNKKLLINESEAIIVKQIFELSLTKGCTTIANYLNNKEIKTRQNKKWRDAVIYHMLINTIYVGQRNYLGIKYDCPQIIDNVLFDTVQANLKSKFNKMSINRKYEYLLDNKMIACGVCGKYYSPNSKPVRNGKIESTYKCCSTRYYKESCGNMGVSVEKLESAVKNLLINEYAASIANRASDSGQSQNKINLLAVEFNEVEGFIRKQLQTESNLIDLFTSGVLTKEKFNIKLDVIRKEQTKLNNQLLNIKSQIAANKILIDAADDWFDIDNLEFVEDERGNSYEVSFINYLNKILIDKKMIKGILSKITIYPTSKRFTKRLNEVCVRCDITIFDEVTRIYISNRTKEIKIIRPNLGNAPRLYV